ncbi:hypothetical protein ACEQPO_21835 [Bacillus sp. SL00103]
MMWLISLQDKTEYVKSPKMTRAESEFVYGINMIYGVNAHTDKNISIKSMKSWL